MPSKRFLEQYPGISSPADAGIRSWIQNTKIEFINRIGLPELDVYGKTQVKNAKQWLEAMEFVDDLVEHKNYVFDEKQQETVLTNLVKYFGSKDFESVTYSHDDKEKLISLIETYGDYRFLAKQAPSALAVAVEYVVTDAVSELKKSDSLTEKSLEHINFLNTISQVNSSALDKTFQSLLENNMISSNLGLFKTFLEKGFNRGTASEDRPYNLNVLGGRFLATYSDLLFSNISELSKERSDLIKNDVPKNVAQVVNKRLSDFSEVMNKSSFSHVLKEDESTIAKNIILVHKRIQSSWLKVFETQDFLRMANTTENYYTSKGIKIPELKSADTVVDKIKNIIKDATTTKKSTLKPKTY